MYVQQKLFWRGFTALMVTGLSAGCGSSNSGSSFNAPAIAPIVNGALPKGLQAASASSVDRSLAHVRTLSDTDNSGDAINYIKAMFNEYFINGINGSTYQGYLNSLIEGVDGRMSGINSQIAGFSNSPACLSNAATSEVFDLSAIDPMLKFTLPYLQCYNPFSAGGGNVAGSGSGADFGTDGKGDYSLWMQLNGSGTGTFDQTGGFITLANIVNYGSTSTTAPETVDGILLNYYVSTSFNRITVARFTASQTTGSFALFLASNQADTSGGATSTTATASSGNSQLGPGLRLISDGTHVYADGYLLDAPTNANKYYAFDMCLNASDLSEDSTATDCATLASSYATTAWASLYPGLTNPNPLATSPTLDYNEVTGCSATVPSTSGTAAQSVSGTCPTTSFPSGNLVTPQTTVLTGTHGLSSLALPATLTNLAN